MDISQPNHDKKPIPAQLLESFAQAQALQQQGELRGAIRLYDAVISKCGEFVEAYYKRANAKHGLGQWDAAVADYDAAIALDPGHAKAYCNRGTALERIGQLEKALASYDRAIDIDPVDFVAYYNRASALRAMQKLDLALRSYECAIALKPDYTEAYVNQGNLLQTLHRHELAISSYTMAIRLNPHIAEAFKGRGSSHEYLKHYIEAIADYGRALSLEPDRDFLLGVRRHAQMHICDWDELDQDLQKLADGVRAGRRVTTPFAMLALLDEPELHRAAARIWAKATVPAQSSVAQRTARGQRERIRIGYFSPDFRNHPVALLAAEMFEAHDKSRFEIFAFAFGPPAADGIRARLGRAFSRFIDVADQSDASVAMLAREAGLDIAVDLAGYTDNSRPGIFALRAAPVQVNFLGYPGTLASDSIDYLIADRVVVPVGNERHYAEKIVFLPNSYLPHDSTRTIAQSSGTREQLGLPAQGFVFCCFNNSYKITPQIFDIWMRILGRIEGSVLWLSRSNTFAAANLRKEAERRGIEARRLVFAERTASLAEHLARHCMADLFLDTLPYNAHATAMDALWAGVPVLTQMGESFASRVAASVLSAVGLPELIAGDAIQYEAMAVALAKDPGNLAKIREKLAQNRLSAPLFDTGLFARHLESAYAAIHARYTAGLQPELHLVALDAG